MSRPLLQNADSLGEGARRRNRRRQDVEVSAAYVVRFAKAADAQVDDELIVSMPARSRSASSSSLRQGDC